jgi:para-nitrobenzyl esterase
LTYGFSFRDQAEDCLYLNVWTAAKDPAERRPVMVWIHGGGNIIGGASAPFYDGRHFAAAGVVLVSIQYRLGAFGYLAHPALSAEAKSRDGREASGNYGLLDQIAALHWVQTNVGRFGGDKDRVTIFGESAGAANVTHLMASPLAQGLFHCAIAQSGYFGENTPQLSQGSGPRSMSAHQNGVEFAERLGVTGEDGAALTALRQLPAEKLLSVPVAIGTVVGGGTGGRAFRFGPVVDGYVLPRAPGEVWAAGRMHRVPLMAGSLLDDGSVFSRANPVQRLFGYRLVMRTIFGPDTARAMELFPAAGDDQVPAAMHRVITVTSFRAPARRLVRWMEAAGGDAWLYHFSRNPGQGRAVRDGVFHGLEIGYVFNTLTAWGDTTDKTLGQDMLRRWVNFARDGDPNGAPGGTTQTDPAWPKYRTAEDQHLEFGDHIRVQAGLDREPCDLADRAAARRNRDGAASEP